MTKLLPGVNIQWPWSRLIVEGEKLVETRGYPLPKKYLGKPLAIIETPGPNGKKSGAVSESQVIGVVQFSATFKYESREEWLKDFKRHRVGPDDINFGFNPKKEKWAWVIERVQKLPKPLDPPKPRGIVFASNVRVYL